MAVVRARDGDDLPLHLGHQRVVLRRPAVLRARLQHARRVVLLQHLHRHALEDREHLVDQLLALLRRRALRPQPLPQPLARAHRLHVRLHRPLLRLRRRAAAAAAAAALGRRARRLPRARRLLLQLGARVHRAHGLEGLLLRRGGGAAALLRRGLLRPLLAEERVVGPLGQLLRVGLLRTLRREVAAPHLAVARLRLLVVALGDGLRLASHFGGTRSITGRRRRVRRWHDGDDDDDAKAAWTRQRAARGSRGALRARARARVSQGSPARALRN